MMRQRGNFLAHRRSQTSLISISSRGNFSIEMINSRGHRNRLRRRPMGVARHPHQSVRGRHSAYRLDVAYPGASLTQVQRERSDRSTHTLSARRWLSKWPQSQVKLEEATKQL